MTALNPDDILTRSRTAKGIHTYTVTHTPTGVSAEATGEILSEVKARAMESLAKVLEVLDTPKDPSIFDDIDEGLKEKFKAYHKANPNIYKEFEYMAIAMKRVRKRYSHSSIIEALRWKMDLKTDGEAFAINNMYKSMYARLLIYNRPEFADFFELRKMKYSSGVLSDEEMYRSKEGSTL